MLDTPSSLKSMYNDALMHSFRMSISLLFRILPNPAFYKRVAANLVITIFAGKMSIQFLKISIEIRIFLKSSFKIRKILFEFRKL